MSTLGSKISDNSLHKGDYCRVHFRVKCETDFGQSVAVSGSIHALGNGAKDRVLHLVTTPEAHPVWFSAEPIVIPRSSTARVSYRYCLVEGGVTKAFEKSENVRSFATSPPNLPSACRGSSDNISSAFGVACDIVLEDCFSLIKLEGFGQDSEMQLFEQMHRLTHTSSTPAITATATSTATATASSSETYPRQDTASTGQQTSHGVPEESGGRLFLVCYHLPVKVRRTGRALPEAPFEVSWGNPSSPSRRRTARHQGVLLLVLPGQSTGIGRDAGSAPLHGWGR